MQLEVYLFFTFLPIPSKILPCPSQVQADHAIQFTSYYYRNYFCIEKLSFALWDFTEGRDLETC